MVTAFRALLGACVVTSVCLMTLYMSSNVLGKYKGMLIQAASISLPFVELSNTMNNASLSIAEKNGFHISVDKIPTLSRQQQIIHNVTMPMPWSANCKRKKFVVIIVDSAPGNLARRNSIRTTWQNMYAVHSKAGRVSDRQIQYNIEDVVKVVFLLGSSTDKGLTEKVKSEALHYRDIVSGSFIDSYNNLTMKTILGLKWTHYFCNANYLLKTDDDLFVNPVALVQWLQGSPRLNFYSGYCNSHSPVVRNKDSKWYVSEAQFADSEYPTYCLGGGYLMTKDILSRVVHHAFTTPLFPMEDLHVGLIIKKLTGIHLVDKRELFQLIYGFKKDPCSLKNVILCHPVTEKMREEMVGMVKRAEEEC